MISWRQTQASLEQTISQIAQQCKESTATVSIGAHQTPMSVLPNYPAWIQNLKPSIKWPNIRIDSIRAFLSPSWTLLPDNPTKGRLPRSTDPSDTRPPPTTEKIRVHASNYTRVLRALEPRIIRRLLVRRMSNEDTKRYLLKTTLWLSSTTPQMRRSWSPISILGTRWLAPVSMKRRSTRRRALRSKKMELPWRDKIRPSDSSIGMSCMISQRALNSTKLTNKRWRLLMLIESVSKHIWSRLVNTYPC